MKIAVLNTGGTISSVGNPLAPMPTNDFAAACRKLMDNILYQQFPALSIDYVEDLIFPGSKFGTLDSTNLQPGDWCLMAACILKHYASYDGWVILHGTDTTAFTGTALPFLLSSFRADGLPTAMLSKPVIITGAQTPLFSQESAQGPLTINFNTDAFQNFCGAVASAQTGIPEVCVYFDHHLYRGNRVLKTNTSQFDAFSSPNYPPLAEYGAKFSINTQNILPPPVRHDVSLDHPAALQRVSRQLASVAERINDFSVMQFNAFPAAYSAKDSSAVIAKLLEACLSVGIKGLILESYGTGNFPSGNPDTPSAGVIYQTLKRANESGVILVNCTQVINGSVNSSVYAAGSWLPTVGALAPADMTPTAAFTKLMVLLAAADNHQWSVADVKHLLQLNLLGEMMNSNRLDSRTNAILLAGQSITTLDGGAALVNDPVLGPVFHDNAGTRLWTALKLPPASEMPGRLVMQNDGNLVYISRNNVVLWATDTGKRESAASMLILNGSSADASLSLQVYDYTSDETSANLYSQT